LIDGALMRTVQAATAGVLLGISGRAFLSPRLFAAIVVGLAFVWTVTAIGTRRPYMSLLRRTVVGSAELGWSDGADPLDLATAEVLVEFLARDNPSEVLAAIDALHRRGHDRLIPALILHHEDERVLVSALALFGASQRTDWHTLARRLLDRPRAWRLGSAARARPESRPASVSSRPSPTLPSPRSGWRRSSSRSPSSARRPRWPSGPFSSRNPRRGTSSSRRFRC